MIELIFFPLNSWIFPIFRLGRKPDYDASDLFKPLKSHKTEILGDRMCKAWDEEVLRKKASGKKPSLLRATIRVFGPEFMMLGFFLFLLEFLLK